MPQNVGSSSESSEASQEQVAVRAYKIYEQEGRPEGRAEDYWLRAEAELKGRGIPIDTVLP